MPRSKININQQVQKLQTREENRDLPFETQGQLNKFNQESLPFVFALFYVMAGECENFFHL